jgi:hypothetical protein
MSYVIDDDAELDLVPAADSSSSTAVGALPLAGVTSLPGVADVLALSLWQKAPCSN